MLLHHAIDADADIVLGMLKVLEQGLGLKHHLASRHRGVEQIGVSLVIDDNDSIV